MTDLGPSPGSQLSGNEYRAAALLLPLVALLRRCLNDRERTFRLSRVHTLLGLVLLPEALCTFTRNVFPRKAQVAQALVIELGKH